MSSGAGSDEADVLPAAVETCEDEEWTPLEALLDAARFGELEEVRKVLMSGESVDVNGVDGSGSTALHLGGTHVSFSLSFVLISC